MTLSPFQGSATAEPATKRQGDVAVEGQRAFQAQHQGPQQPQQPAPQTPVNGGQQPSGQQLQQAAPAEQVDPTALLAQLQSPAPASAPQTPANEVPQNDGTQPGETPEQKPTGSPTDTNKDEMRAMLAQLVKEEFGTDLTQLKEQQERQRLQNEAAQLQQIWGVDQGELSRRLGILGKAIEGLPENSRQAFTNPAALNILWTAVQAQSTDQAPDWNGSASSSVPRATQLTEQEIERMDPTEYRERQAEIMSFYQSRAV